MIQMTGNNEKNSFVSKLESAKEFWRQGQLAAAIALAQELTTTFPQKAAGWGYLAEFEAENGDVAAATAHAKVATSIAPHSEPASLILFRCLWKLGDRVAAAEEAKRYLSTGRQSDEYQLIIDEIKSA